MKTISILGSGWLGKPLIKTLVSKGYTVKASTTRPEKLAQLKAYHSQPFLLDIDHLDPQIVDFFDADSLVINITSKNLESFKTLAHFISQSSLKQVIFVSSTGVYPANNDIVSETQAELSPHSHLVPVEKLFMNPQSTIIRFGGLIGPGRHPGHFFLSGKPVKNPQAPVNLIHLDDCVAIIQHVIKDNILGEIVNAVADTHPIKQEFYTRAAIPYGYTPTFSPDHGNYKIVSNQKLKDLLHYDFIHGDLFKALDAIEV